MSTSELAMTYAALILHDSGAEINADNLNKIVKAAGITADGYWAPLFAKLFKARSVSSLVSSVGASAPAPAAAAPVAAAPAAGKKDAAPAPKVEEEKEEEVAAFDLFD